MEEIEKPKLHDFYKKILVEEVLIYDHPVECHYGLCAILGEVIIKQGAPFLKRISLPHLHFYLPDACSHLPIIPVEKDNVFVTIPPKKCYELFGEICLIKKNDRPMENSKLRYTSIDVYAMLETSNNFEETYKETKEQFNPVFLVYEAVEIRQPEELLTSYLRLRKIEQNSFIGCNY